MRRLLVALALLVCLPAWGELRTELETSLTTSLRTSLDTTSAASSFTCPENGDLCRFTGAAADPNCIAQGWDSGTPGAWATTLCVGNHFDGDDGVGASHVEEDGEITCDATGRCEAWADITLTTILATATRVGPALRRNTDAAVLCATALNGASPASIFAEAGSAVRVDTGADVALGTTVRITWIFDAFDGRCDVYVDPAGSNSRNGSLGFASAVDATKAGSVPSRLRLASYSAHFLVEADNVAVCAGYCQRDAATWELVAYGDSLTEGISPAEPNSWCDYIGWPQSCQNEGLGGETAQAGGGRVETDLASPGSVIPLGTHYVSLFYGSNDADGGGSFDVNVDVVSPLTDAADALIAAGHTPVFWAPIPRYSPPGDCPIPPTAETENTDSAPQSAAIQSAIRTLAATYRAPFIDAYAEFKFAGNPPLCPDGGADPGHWMHSDELHLNEAGSMVVSDFALEAINAHWQRRGGASLAAGATRTPIAAPYCSTVSLPASSECVDFEANVSCATHGITGSGGIDCQDRSRPLERLVGMRVRDEGTVDATWNFGTSVCTGTGKCQIAATFRVDLTSENPSSRFWTRVLSTAPAVMADFRASPLDPGGTGQVEILNAAAAQQAITTGGAFNKELELVVCHEIDYASDRVIVALDPVPGIACTGALDSAQWDSAGLGSTVIDRIELRNGQGRWEDVRWDSLLACPGACFTDAPVADAGFDDQWTQLALGDLSVDRTRVPRYYEPFSPPSTAGWTTYDVTDSATCSALALGAGCELTPDSSPYDVDNDAALLQAIVNAAGSESVFEIPTAGDYYFGGNGQGQLTLNASNQVLDCSTPGVAISWDKIQNAGSGAMVALGSMSDIANVYGGDVPWTAGFSGNVVTLDSGDPDFAGLSPGDWVVCLGDVGEVTAQNGADYPGIAAKITSIDGADVTLDRYIRQEPDGLGGEVCFEWSPVTNVGIQGCALAHLKPWEVQCPTAGGCVCRDDTDCWPGSCPANCTRHSDCGDVDVRASGGSPGGTPSSLEPSCADGTTGGLGGADPEYDLSFGALVKVSNAAEFWITDVDLGASGQRHVGLKGAVRGLIAHSAVGPQLYEEKPFNQASIANDTGQPVQDVVILNNAFHDVTVGVLWQDGAEGNVVAYNHCDQSPGAVYSLTSNAGRCGFNHGDWTSFNLWEGNDFENRYDIDDTYDPNGPFNTLYLGRWRKGTGANGYGLHSESLSGSRWAYTDLNAIGVYAPRVRGAPAPVMVFDQDDGPGIVNARLHLERSVLWEEVDLGPDETTTQVDVQTGDAYAGWSAETWPLSLFLTSEPPWWCAESGAWDDLDVRAAGARADDHTGTFRELPAKRRLDGLPCT